jgi:hypothetical protein
MSRSQLKPPQDRALDALAKWFNGLKLYGRFLEIYNERVNTVEIDKSMLIEISQSLLR